MALKRAHDQIDHVDEQPEALSFRVPDAKLFKAFIDAMLPLRIEYDINITFTPTSVRACFLDSGHTSILKFELSAERFLDYYCPREQILGINLGELTRNLGSVGKHDAIFMRHIYGSTKFTMRIVTSEERTSDGRLKQMRKTSTYNLNTYDYDEEAIDIPKVHYHACVDLASVQYVSIIKELLHVGDVATFEAWPEGIMLFSIVTGTTPDVTIRLERDPDYPDYACVAERYAKSLFSLTCLMNFAPACKLGTHMRLRFNHDTLEPDGVMAPLELRFEFPLGCMTCYLAPQIPDN